MRGTRLLLILALVFAVAAPAAADHGDIHPTLRNERVYFKCAGSPNKVQNLELLLNDALPTWNTDAPTQSVQAGAGCGTADPGLSGTANENIYDGVWKGTFTGNLTALNVELHSIDTVARATDSHPILVRLYVDGVEVVPSTQVVATTVRSSTQASKKLTFSITHLPFVKEDGDGTTEREITLTVANYVDGDNGPWVWDTTEVPAGIDFNPAQLDAARIRS